MSGTHMAAISKSKIKIPKIQNFQVALAHMAPEKTNVIQPWVMGISRKPFISKMIATRPNPTVKNS